MTLNKVLVVLAFAVALPTAALAQPFASAPAANAGCCAADDGSIAAAAVLLPPLATAPAKACCSDVAVDHSAHARAPETGAPAAMAHGTGAMACCDHAAKEQAAEAESGCCGDMKDGCDMPCCAGMRPER